MGRVYVLLWVEVTLLFLEMVAQHLLPRVPQCIELPSPCLVPLIIMGVVDVGRFGYCFSLDLTRFLAKLSAMLRLRHGLGTFPSSLLFDLRTFLSDFVSRSGVYLILTYLCVFVFSPLRSLSRF